MLDSNNYSVLIRGAGDLASGVALRLHRVGLKVILTELPQPLAVRRTVSFAEAVYSGRIEVEGVAGVLLEPGQVRAGLEANQIPVVVDPDADILNQVKIPIVVDARLTKRSPAPLPVSPMLHIGLGPGFHAGQDCQAVVETRRSHTLGRVIWDGPSQPDSGEPEGDPRRVLRAPAEGEFIGYAQIGEFVEEGQVLAQVGKQQVVTSPLRGVLRGILHDGLTVTKGLKVGDVDPRRDPQVCFLVSDKALAVGGGVLEAILTHEEIRKILW